MANVPAANGVEGQLIYLMVPIALLPLIPAMMLPDTAAALVACQALCALMLLTGIVCGTWQSTETSRDPGSHRFLSGLAMIDPFNPAVPRGTWIFKRSPPRGPMSKPIRRINQPADQPTS